LLSSVFQLIVLIHVIVLNIKIKTAKLVKFHVTSGAYEQRILQQGRGLATKNQVIVSRKKKNKIKSGQGSQREARYPDGLVD
jgi:hypothetical protein